MKKNNNCSNTRSNNFWSKCLPFIKRASNQRNNNEIKKDSKTLVVYYST